MKIYKKGNSAYIQLNNSLYLLNVPDWDEFLNRDELRNLILSDLQGAVIVNEPFSLDESFDAPMGNQEIWAAGVTYLRSKVERKKESVKSGSSIFYDKVYEATRPEIFYKANAHRTVGSGHQINIRRDSSWNVPEPELTLFINSSGGIQAYTIGNDLSSRSIEGENPLYLPQAKTWDKCASIGPCLFLPDEPFSPDTNIRLVIKRNSEKIFSEKTSIRKMKRGFDELIEFLFRESEFHSGCFLMTGTGIVPPEDFTLEVGDEVRIAIDGIGELVNFISIKTK
jgi:2-dehydro-3-deoxy-D-arabinonate dehydratase